MAYTGRVPGRDPRTRDCAIRGCDRAERRYGLCGAHSRLLPRDFGYTVMARSVDAQLAVSEKARREAIAYVRKVLRGGKAKAR